MIMHVPTSKPEERLAINQYMANSLIKFSTMVAAVVLAQAHGVAVTFTRAAAAVVMAAAAAVEAVEAVVAMEHKQCPRIPMTTKPQQVL